MKKLQKHGNWKGGCHGTWKRIMIEAGLNTESCWLCNDATKLQVHHTDRNQKNNDPRNLCMLCSYCHFAIHDDEYRRNTRFKKGYNSSEETRKNISKSAKLRFQKESAWNKGKQYGIIDWKDTDEVNKRFREVYNPKYKDKRQQYYLKNKDKLKERFKLNYQKRKVKQ